MPEQTAMPLGATTDKPSSLWRAWSSATMFEIGALCRAFLLYASTPEINGLESFMELLDSRSDPSKRTRGLITGTACRNWTFLCRRTLLWELSGLLTARGL